MIKRIVDGIPVYFEIDKDSLEFQAFIKIKRKYNRYYYFCYCFDQLINWSIKTINQKIHYRNMYINLFKDILIDGLKNKSIDYEVIEREIIPDFNKVKTLDIILTTELIHMKLFIII